MRLICFASTPFFRESARARHRKRWCWCSWPCRSVSSGARAAEDIAKHAIVERLSPRVAERPDLSGLIGAFDAVPRIHLGRATTATGPARNDRIDRDRAAWLCGNRILRRVRAESSRVLHAIDATPARWRGDAASPLVLARRAGSPTRRRWVAYHGQICTNMLFSPTGDDGHRSSRPAADYHDGLCARARSTSAATGPPQHSGSERYRIARRSSAWGALTCWC